MNPFYSDDTVAIYQADARDVLPLLRAELVRDAEANGFGDIHVVTDPPYGIGLDYGDTKDNWRPDRTFWGLLNGCMVGAVVTLHMTVSNRHLPFWVAETEAGGWEYLHCSVYWNETRAGGNGNGQFAYAWEPLLSFKAKGSQFALGKRMLTDVFRHEGHKETIHPAERTLGCWLEFMSHLPPGLIIDPFCGSGTTLVAAKQLGFQAIGIERERHWAEVAANRCAQGTLFTAA